MQPAARRQLAQDLCARLAAHYPEQVIIGGVFGSVARGSDTSWSDLEMLFVVRDGCQAEGKLFIFRDTAVGYHVFTRSNLEALLTDPTLESGHDWPFWMGVLSVLKVLYGDPRQVEAWLQLGRSAPREKFHQALAARLPGLVLESYGRILSCSERQNTTDLSCAVIEVLLEMNLALCLLNQSWVTHDYYQGIIDAGAFARLPRDFQTLAPALWSASDVEEIVPLARTLVDNFYQLLAEEGIRIDNYQHVEDLLL